MASPHIGNAGDADTLLDPVHEALGLWRVRQQHLDGHACMQQAVMSSAHTRSMACSAPPESLCVATTHLNLTLEVVHVDRFEGLLAKQPAQV